MGLWSFFLIFFKLIKNIIGSENKMDTNNLSTIATFLAICITGILAYFGYTVDQAQLATVLMSVITLIIAIWSSKNPNTLAFLGNAPTPVESEETVLNDEYEV
jgi:uncharacterized membrane protein